MKNVGLVGDADKSVEMYVAKRTWPYEVNPPGRNKLHSFIHSFQAPFILYGFLYGSAWAHRQPLFSRVSGAVLGFMVAPKPIRARQSALCLGL
jgi:hypothetical protein